MSAVDEKPMFRCTMGYTTQVELFTAKLCEEFEKRPILSKLAIKGQDDAAAEIEKSLGDDKGIVRKFRAELVNALLETLATHFADEATWEGIVDGESSDGK